VFGKKHGSGGPQLGQGSEEETMFELYRTNAKVKTIETIIKM
jgi:hypothetical protein